MLITVLGKHVDFGESGNRKHKQGEIPRSKRKVKKAIYQAK